MDQLYRPVCAVEPTPAAGRNGPAAWQRPTRRDRRAAGKCGPAALGLSRLPLASVAPAWPCARLAALPLRAVRAYLQCLDWHAAGALAPQIAMDRVCRLSARLRLSTPGRPTAGCAPQHHLSLAPPFFNDRQDGPAAWPAWHRRGRRVISAGLGKGIQKDDASGPPPGRPCAPTWHFQ